MSLVEIDEICHQDTLAIDFNTFTIPEFNVEEFSYNAFFKNYMLKNIPCVLKGVTCSWICNDQWISNPGDKINFTYLNEVFGNMVAPVADCNAIIHNAQIKTNMKLTDYLLYLQNPDKCNVLYLKDWHLSKSSRCPFYELPELFSSDWLNEYADDTQGDDYKFVYIGPTDSWTPLHSDVYNSYSWSVNVIGSKKWILFPPGEDIKLKDTFGNLPLLFSKELHKNIKFFEVIQKKGDAIFVPSKWHHQVVNLEDTISINHNWINGCNINIVWQSLMDSWHEIQNEITDIRDSPDFDFECKKILKSLFGMDFDDFFSIIYHIADKRLSELNGDEIKHSKYKLGIKHIKFDLLSIFNVLENILLQQITSTKYDIKCLLLLKNKILPYTKY